MKIIGHLLAAINDPHEAMKIPPIFLCFAYLFMQASGKYVEGHIKTLEVSLDAN